MKQKKSSYKMSEYTIDLVNQDYGIIVSSPDAEFTIKNTERFLEEMRKEAEKLRTNRKENQNSDFR